MLKQQCIRAIASRPAYSWRVLCPFTTLYSDLASSHSAVSVASSLPEGPREASVRADELGAVETHNSSGEQRPPGRFGHHIDRTACLPSGKLVGMKVDTRPAR